MQRGNAYKNQRATAGVAKNSAKHLTKNETYRIKLADSRAGITGTVVGLTESGKVEELIHGQVLLVLLSPPRKK